MKAPAKLPKYKEIIRQIEADIQSGKYAPGRKLPSEASLVRLYSTSRITIGRAFRELVQKGVVFRRSGSGSFVRENMAAMASSDWVFGLLIPELGDSEILGSICQGMARGPQGRALLWGSNTINSETKEAHALALCNQYISQKVSGVFFAPLYSVPNGEGERANLRIISMLRNANIPVVLIERDIVPYPRRSVFDLIGIDNWRAGYMITEHLIERGCRRIGYVSYRDPGQNGQARIAGFRDALAAAGIAFGKRSVQIINVSEVSEVRRIVRATRPEGLVCCDDFTAGQLMHSLITLGHRIPGEMRIGSIDDVKYSRLLPVPLTTVHQPCQEIGEAAMSAMIERVTHPKRLGQQILLNCDIVVRASSGLSKAKGRSRT